MAYRIKTGNISEGQCIIFVNILVYLPFKSVILKLISVLSELSKIFAKMNKKVVFYIIVLVNILKQSKCIFQICLSKYILFVIINIKNHVA